MTVTQEKYYYIDSNEDGSQTIKGILEFTNSLNKEGFLAYRIRLDLGVRSATVFVSDLIGSSGVRIYPNFESIANLLWKKHLRQYQEIKPGNVLWIEHEGKFNGMHDRVDIRDPYGTDFNLYTRLVTNWNNREQKYEFDADSRASYQHIPNPTKGELYPANIFGRVNEITTKLGWYKNVNRLDIEYSIERVNADGSTILKTIFFWEHPDYPSNCLVRIWFRAKDVIIIMTELRSNIPPQCNLRSVRTNMVPHCLLEVMNGIYVKYLDRLEKYRFDRINWIYEWGEFSTFNDQISWGQYDSSLELVEISQTEQKKAEFTRVEIKEDREDSSCQAIQTLLRGEPFGRVPDSLEELGWNNY